MLFSDKESLSVLAALRMLQDAMESEPESVAAMSHFDDGSEPLTTKEIDALCDRLHTDGFNPQDRIEQLKWLKEKGLTQSECIEIFGVDRDSNSYGRRAKTEYASDDIEFDENVLLSETDKGCWVQGWLYVEDNVEELMGRLRDLGWVDSDVEHDALMCQLHPEAEAVATENDDSLNIGIYRKSDNEYLGNIDGDFHPPSEIHEIYLKGEWSPD